MGTRQIPEPDTEVKAINRTVFAAYSAKELILFKIGGGKIKSEELYDREKDSTWVWMKILCPCSNHLFITEGNCLYMYKSF